MILFQLDRPTENLFGGYTGVLLRSNPRHQQKCAMEEEIRDHRGKLRDRSNIRDVYYLSPNRYKSLVLNEDSLDDLADRYGYSKLYMMQTTPMASYRRGPCHLNFSLTTGTVGSELEHPKRGKFQLFRKDVSMGEAEAVFRNPRLRTFSNPASENRGP